jgi:tRNA A37 N6-isopentenylltransferase MiaA
MSSCGSFVKETQQRCSCAACQVLGYRCCIPALAGSDLVALNDVPAVAEAQTSKGCCAQLVWLMQYQGKQYVFI